MTKNYYTWEEVKAKAFAPKPWWKRSWRWLRRNVSMSNLRYQRRRIKWAGQRTRRGWSDQDAWGFDYYLAGVIAGGLANIRNGHTYPGDEEFPTHQAWQDYLDGIIGPLKTYHETDNPTEEMYQEAVTAMHRLADRFGHMWD